MMETKEIYRINATLATKWHAGQILRSERVVTIVLGTPEGVKRWLLENAPYVGYSVYNLVEKFDCTDKFGGYPIVQSRYNQEPLVLKGLR